MSETNTRATKVRDQDRRNRYAFGLGTFGRDFSYTLVAMYLVFYLTDVVRITGATLAATTAVIVAARVFDAVSDPVIGVLVDNTRTRWGKFRPWIVIGALCTFIMLVLLFTDFGLQGATFVWLFAAIYLAYSVSFTSNDVAYWSMLPALSQSQLQRDRIGAFSRICASIGAFAMVVGIVPLSAALTEVTGSETRAYQLIAVLAGVLLLVFQSITVLFAREDTSIPSTFERTRFRDLGRILFKNDQLVVVAIAMSLYTTGNTITISLGIYYFKYVYGDEGMYSIFALVLGVSTIGAMAAYPLLSKRFTRRQLFGGAMILVVAGYVLFFFSPTSTMIFIGIAGVGMFVGQAIIQVLILMFVADTVEYGQWKLGTRNESVVFSVQPFINKLASALAAGVVGATVLLAHTQSVPAGQVLEGGNLMIFKVAMMGLPLVLITTSYFVYHRYYKINAQFYEQMVAEIEARENQKPNEGEMRSAVQPG